MAEVDEVAVVGSRIEAELICGMLRSSGIRSAVATDDAGGGEPQFQRTAGVRVLVALKDEASAKRVIEQAG